MGGPSGLGPGSGRSSFGGLDRREFMKLAGGAAAGFLGTLGAAYALSRFLPSPVPSAPPAVWDVSPGVADYSKVPTDLSGPTPGILKVAQWYDYWPGAFITDFVTFMTQVYGKTIDVQVSIYTSNEELYQWITLGRQSFDVIFPSNSLLDSLKNANRVYNLNLDWIPNFANLDPAFVSTPAPDPYDRRGPNGAYIGLPYFWGTTGLGYRTDKIPAADVANEGVDFLWMTSFIPSDPAYPSVPLAQKMTMLDDERDVLGWGFKKAGWEWQVGQALTPTGTSPPQWSVNETDASRVSAMRQQLLAAKPNLIASNSTDVVRDLVAGTVIVAQAWSGAMMYAMRPDQTVPVPVGFQIPKQGSTWWIDAMAIPSTSRNLWLAHQFFNFIHSVDPAWPENQTLTKWNLYSTPNAACYEILKTNPYPNGWNMADDPVLYPNVNDSQGFAVCQLARDVGSSVTIYEYDPVWDEFRSP